MMAHPGKKLNFMGNEIAQWREWDEDKPMDEMLLQYPAHDAFRRYFAHLGWLYHQYPALYQGEYDSSCFEWMTADALTEGVYAFLRKGPGGDILAVMNTQDQPLHEFRVGVPYPCVARPLVSSQDQQWDGTAGPLGAPVQSLPDGWHGHLCSLSLDLPPLCGMLFVLER